MLAYVVRRVLYAIPILVGINIATFALFFLVNTPDDMARMQLGQKRVTPRNGRRSGATTSRSSTTGGRSPTPSSTRNR
jgi:ABC-type microcin C transport system permease subunit YejB